MGCATFMLYAVQFPLPLGAQSRDDMSSNVGRGQTARPSAESTGRRSSSPKAAPTGAPKTVTLKFRDVTIAQAIAAIGTQAGVEILYSNRVVPAQRKVTVVATNIQVMDALRLVLRGTGVGPKLAADGQITLVKIETPTSTAPQGRGAVIIGVVKDAHRAEGISRVRVGVEELKMVVATGENGSYVLASVPAGAHVMTARALGYQVLRERINAADGDTIVVNFVLTPIPTQLTGVVTTGSGDRARLEVGTVIETIDADSVTDMHSITSITDLIAARVPGVQVSRPTGAVGAARRVRIRGIQSMVGSNEPIYILDGIRISNEVGVCGGQSADSHCGDVPSRIDDLDPDIIESIDVLKGASASTLYGSDAANGVIVIKTKRGQPGPTRWGVRADRSVSFHSASDYPVLAKAFGRNILGQYGPCALADQAAGYCTEVDTIIRSNILGDPNTTPLAHGRMTDVSMDVSGGVPTIQYFLSAGYNDKLAANKMPNAVVSLLERAKGVPVSFEARRPSAEKLLSATARLTGQLGAGRDFSVTSSLARRENRRGPDGLSDAYTVRMPDDTSTLMSAWREFYWERNERTTHNTSSATLNWVVLPLVSLHGTAGVDYAFRDYKELARRGACEPLCGQDFTHLALGRIEGGRETNFGRSADIGMVFDMPLSAFRLRTSTGAQYNRSELEVLTGQQSDLAFGQDNFRYGIGSFVPGGPDFLLPTGVDRASNQSATAGLYVEQSIVFKDRLFLNVAARRDLSSQFGPEAEPPVYPKFNVSWLVSDEPAFPWQRWMNLRLRAAYGQAGKPPESTTRLRTFFQNSFFVNPDGTTGTYADLQSIGNLIVRPERTIEREYGFDAGFFEDRLQLSFQRFHKFTRDALVPKPIPPSLGSGSVTSTLLENIGNVRNVGNELTVNARILQSTVMSLGSRVSFASRHNTLVTLGTGVNPFDYSGSENSRIAEGYPLYGRWARPILDFADVNNDGLISKDEIVIGDSLVYLGPQLNPYDITFSQNVGLFNDQIQIAADFQYNNGVTQVNRFLATNALSLASTNIRGAGTLRDQAYAVAASEVQNGGTGMNTLYGYVETANILRFNNLSVTYRLPDRFARFVRSRSAGISVLGENLGLWTNYGGHDPENGRSEGRTDIPNNAFADDGQFSQPTRWSMRVNLTF